ncbi:MAG TPA: hypothetical protein VIK78_03285 [Ruminiclostridium sp.]
MIGFYQWRVGGFARTIYLDGTKTFEIAIAESPLYEQAIMVYASTGFTYGQIDNALAKGYISQEHYDITITLKLLIEPRPLMGEQPTI